MAMVNNKKRILIVDDEESIRKLLCQKLSKEGYLCAEAGSAEQTLDKLKGALNELVILDINMPIKSGIELLSEIKTNYPDIGVIMATAVAETNIAVECMKQGADDYICKHFDLNQVVMSVARTVDRQSLQLKIKEYQQSLEHKVGEQTAEIRRLFLGAIEALVCALEAKDKYTGGHSRRVTEIAMSIGSALDLSAEDMEDLRWASLLHDVGKIAVDQLIQNKPGN